jgi:ubiquinone/menaquinone biosynthesis C-methylase UbiE
VELDEYRRMAETKTSHWWYESTRRLLDQVLGPSLEPGGTFLDVGCGTGATDLWMLPRGHLVGVDVEPLALTLFREGHPEVAGLAACDAAALPFADGAFDALLCVTVLNHRSVTSPEAVVAEFVRVVKPGGVVCLMEPGVRRLRRAHDRVVHTVRRFSRSDLAGLLRANGLVVERATGAYAFLVPAAAVKAVLERGREASDLARNESGLGGTFGRLAGAERALLRRTDLPFGLSVLAIGRKPAGRA